MRRWMVLLTLALCLAGETAAADKARDIASDADSQYHAALRLAVYRHAGQILQQLQL